MHILRMESKRITGGTTADEKCRLRNRSEVRKNKSDRCRCSENMCANAARVSWFKSSFGSGKTHEIHFELWRTFDMAHWSFRCQTKRCQRKWHYSPKPDVLEQTIWLQFTCMLIILLFIQSMSNAVLVIHLKIISCVESFAAGRAVEWIGEVEGQKFARLSIRRQRWMGRTTSLAVQIKSWHHPTESNERFIFRKFSTFFKWKIFQCTLSHHSNSNKNVLQ